MHLNLSTQRSQRARRPTSKALLCSQSVISSSQQILNSAPLAVLSPNEAIKSMLIPHSPITWEGSVRATTHKHRPCTNTLPGHKARPQVWWGGTHSLQTNRTKRAWSIRPSDFDLVLTHDVGQHVNSRACVSEGAGALLPGLLQHHLPTAAVAVRTTSIISIQRMQLVTTAVWALAEVQNSSTSPLSLSSSSLAQFSECAFCSRRLTMMKTTGNLWTHWQGG